MLFICYPDQLQLNRLNPLTGPLTRLIFSSVLKILILSQDKPQKKLELHADVPAVTESA